MFTQYYIYECVYVYNPSLDAQTTSVTSRSPFIHLTILTNTYPTAVYYSASNLRQKLLPNVAEMNIC